MAKPDPPRNRTLLWAALPVLLGLAAQWPVLRSDFFRDDFLHLYDIANDGIGSFLFSPYGGHFYLARNLVFAATYEAFGLWAAPYFCSVMAVHCLNAALFFLVLKRQTGSEALAALSAAVWSTSPLHTQMLEWYSAFGHALAVTMLLLALLCAERRRTAALLLFAGSTCYGVGIATALLFPAFAWLGSRPEVRAREAAYFCRLIVAVPILYMVSPFLSGLFDTADRLEASASDLLPLVLWIPNFLLRLALFGAGTLPFLSSALLAFGEVLRLPLSLLALGGVLAMAWAAGGESRRRAAAWLLLAFGAYGMIAVGRAGLYHDAGRDFALAAREPRYHYAGQLALCAAAAIALGALANRPAAARTRVRSVAAGGSLLLCLLNLRTVLHHEPLPTGRTDLTRLQQSLTARITSQPPGATVCLPNEHFANVDFWVVGLRGERFPGAAGVYVLWQDPELATRNVRFVESNSRVLEYVRGRHGRVREVLVGEGECPLTPRSNAGSG